MIRTITMALGILGLAAGTALAAHAPNAVGMTEMGGSVYYDPYLSKPQPHPSASNQHSDVGVTQEGGGVYRKPS
jgi:hypothetical protein